MAGWQNSLKIEESNVRTIARYQILFDKDDLLIIPEDRAFEFIKNIHIDIWHAGGRSQIRMQKPYNTIKNLGRTCYAVSKCCALFQESKEYNPRKGRVLRGIYSDEPFSVISTDIVGPYELRNFVKECESSKFWLLAATDICSRLSKVMLLEKTCSKSICDLLENHWMKDHPKQKTIISDQGKPYTSRTYRTFMRAKSINKLCFHLQSNMKRNKRTYKLHDKFRLEDSQKYVSLRGNQHHQHVVKLFLP
ncbi:hypothetical protein RF11_02725 [Thelohanellus kitauei]|uniref:Integrase catalytic domain-containing protein n=1 Tax=Thelohanellus kitauei TaxID=669202 RepID=A0A0C2MLR4_THEKT|nr:hypothetical protein RF11_02725 [Thelohanellus kitauei]